MFFKGKSFIVKMVKDDDVENAESVRIDLDEALGKVVQAGLVLMGAYFVGSTVRQLVTGFAPPAQIVNTVAPVFNNDNSSVVNFGGYARKIVKCLENDDLMESVKAAAASAGVNPSIMSKHLNGRPGYEDIYGKHYEIIGLGTTG